MYGKRGGVRTFRCKIYRALFQGSAGCHTATYRTEISDSHDIITIQKGSYRNLSESLLSSCTGSVKSIPGFACRKAVRFSCRRPDRNHSKEVDHLFPCKMSGFIHHAHMALNFSSNCALSICMAKSTSDRPSSDDELSLSL